MAFSEFQYPDVLTQFALTYHAVDDLFAGVPSVTPLASTREALATSTRLASILNNEKARSEWMIAPILGDFWGRYHGQIGLYSGVDFQADPAAGLSGYLDYAFCRGPQNVSISPPTLLVFEAKRENINEGLGQCVAGVVGAQRFNRRHGIDEPNLYGCVTTGTAWRFLRLNGTTLTVGLNEYTIDQIDRLLGIFASIMGSPSAQAAAA